MTDKIDGTLSEDLRLCIDAALKDNQNEASIKKHLDDIAYEFQWRVEAAIKDDLALNLSGWVVEMAQRAVEAILGGNEDQMRRYLSCEKRGDGGYAGWTGRSDSEYWGRKREAHEQHPVIHGELFEQGAVSLRKQIVDAHRDVLVNERILDLEDQVRSLIAQNNKLTAEKEDLWRRIRAA